MYYSEVKSPMSDNVLLCSKVPQVSPACPSDRSTIKMDISVEQWCNDTAGGKMMYWEKNLSWCHCVHDKHHTEWPGIEPRSTR
jgi:hypothetical protein